MNKSISISFCISLVFITSIFTGALLLFFKSFLRNNLLLKERSTSRYADFNSFFDMNNEFLKDLGVMREEKEFSRIIIFIADALSYKCTNTSYLYPYSCH